MWFSVRSSVAAKRSGIGFIATKHSTDLDIFRASAAGTRRCEATVSQIGDRIGERTGRSVTLTSIVDPDILGGIVLRVGNSILDASVRNRLEQLRKQVARG